jgi:hypothetical protein
MEKPDRPSIEIVPFDAPKQAIAALQRLRRSYKGLATEPATEADRAVLRAVTTTLHNAKTAQRLA